MNQGKAVGGYSMEIVSLRSGRPDRARPPRRRLLVHAFEQFGNCDSQRSRDRLDAFQRQISFPSLDRTDVGVMQTADFGEFLLGPVLALPELTDSNAQAPLNPLHLTNNLSTLLLSPETMSSIF